MSLYEHPARRLEFAIAGAVLALLLQIGVAVDLQQPLLRMLQAQVEQLGLSFEWLWASLPQLLAVSA